MNETLSPIKRLLAETPPFWIKVQIISLVILGIAGELAKLNFLPEKIYILITGAGAAVAAVAQFAIKDSPVLLEAIEHPDTLLEHIPDILNQVSQIRDAVTKPEAVAMALMKARKEHSDATYGGDQAKVVPLTPAAQAPAATDYPDIPTNDK